jgi:signal transduction histidine kinase
MAEHRPEPVDLAVVTRDALDLFEALIPANIDLKREIGLGGERVLADATLLNQVVLNLCSNAVQAITAAAPESLRKSRRPSVSFKGISQLQ